MTWMIDLRKSATMPSGEDKRTGDAKRKLGDMEDRMRIYNINSGILEGETKENWEEAVFKELMIENFIERKKGTNPEMDKANHVLSM